MGAGRLHAHAGRCDENGNKAEGQDARDASTPNDRDKKQAVMSEASGSRPANTPHVSLQVDSIG